MNGQKQKFSELKKQAREAMAEPYETRCAKMGSV